ncbi:uncharacterized protein C8R40DRAFT_181664 [Lentinula edodes]|uniref:uncharacterized protein n=1 Tax=Lentinula edodes TaxID=5353 RepID=UPI001E8CBDBA|nr:uncharacterized protein C8R40DRAFT_181664 [Lentinula edodes]KAH7875623.1 hypothetical protein C8R40DRAFT_181664 [Lentinula edodes]
MSTLLPRLEYRCLDISRISMKLNSPLPQPLPKECAKAAKIFKSFVDSGNNGLDGVIPRHVLENAKGFAIFSVFKAGFLFSARAGSGIVIAKLPDGTWSAPSAIGTAGLGVGGQLGAEMTDFLVVLNSRSSIRSFMAAGSLTLGGNASIAVGPLGRNGEASGSLNSSGKVAAMYSYSKTRGLFGGISVEGSVIVERQDANIQAYENDSVTAKLLLSGMPGNRPWIDDSREDVGYAFGGLASPGAETAATLRKTRKGGDKSPYPPASWGEPKSSGSYFDSRINTGSNDYTNGTNTFSPKSTSQSSKSLSISVPHRELDDDSVTSSFDTRFESDYSPEEDLRRPSRMSLYTPKEQADPFASLGDLSGHGRSMSMASPSPFSSNNRRYSSNLFSSSLPSSKLSSTMASMPISSPITNAQQYIAPKPELAKPLLRHEGVARAIALYNFDGVEVLIQSGDLSLKKGDVIIITKKSESSDDWWTGKIDNRKGIFPANFVELVG